MTLEQTQNWSSAMLLTHILVEIKV